MMIQTARYQAKKDGMRKALLAAALCLVTLFVTAQAAYASVCPCSCSRSHHTQTRQVIHDQHSMTRDFITAQFRFHELWFLNTFFLERIRPALMLMAEQLTVVGMNQMFILGTFFDAQNQLDTMLVFQRKAAEAHKKYHPSVEMCSFGTLTRSLAPAQRNAEFTTAVLTKRAQDRHLGIQFTGGEGGLLSDRKARLAQFVARYCDPSDNLGDLGALCPTAAPAATRNNDVSYHRMVEHPRTIDIDFSNAEPTDGEQDIIALANNLYGHEVYDRLTSRAADTEAANDDYSELRSLLAKRAVAENSFNAIVGLKSRAPQSTDGEQGATAYMRTVLQELGISRTNPNEMADLFGNLIDTGDTLRPSYYAQLELLTQRIYQNPTFYTNLYDKPANVERKNAVMQALGLMLDRNSFKSELRAESLMSVWLETELLLYQEKVQNAIGGQTKKDQPVPGMAAPAN